MLSVQPAWPAVQDACIYSPAACQCFDRRTPGEWRGNVLSSLWLKAVSGPQREGCQSAILFAKPGIFLWQHPSGATGVENHMRRRWIHKCEKLFLTRNNIRFVNCAVAHGLACLTEQKFTTELTNTPYKLSEIRIDWITSTFKWRMLSDGSLKVNLGN